MHIEEGDIDGLREVLLSKFIRVQKKIAGTITDDKENPFKPFVDGVIIPEPPFEIIQKGNASKVPIILGWNEDELGIIGNYLNQVDEKRKKIILEMIKIRIHNHGVNNEGIDKLIRAYKPVMEAKYPDNTYKYWDAILSDSMFRIPTIRQIEAHLEHQSNIFCYIFTYKSSKYGGAFHTIEIPFVFGTTKNADMPDGAIQFNEETEALERNMMDTWVTFAHTGNPNHKGIPEWPPYDIQKRATMMLGVNPKVEYAPMDKLRKVWTDII